jgi:hypothetical protein
LYKLTEVAFYSAEDDDRYTAEDVEDAEELLAIINEAVMLGFLWAKLEADMNLRPLADKEEWRNQKSRDGGLNSVNTRREKARQTWMNEAEVMAKAIRKKNPGFSQDKLADEISFRWSVNDNLPGHPRLKQFISELENSNQLVRRVPKPKLKNPSEGR